MNQLIKQTDTKYLKESLEIYARIVNELDEVPQLSLQTLYFRYFEYIEDVLKDITGGVIGEHIGRNVVIDELGDEEYFAVMDYVNCKLPDIEMEVTEFVLTNWLEQNLHFCDAYDNYFSEPTKGVW